MRDTLLFVEQDQMDFFLLYHKILPRWTAKYVRKRFIHFLSSHTLFRRKSYYSYRAPSEKPLP